MLHRRFGQTHAMFTALQHFTSYLRANFLVVALYLLLCLSSCDQLPQVLVPVITPHPDPTQRITNPTSTPTPTSIASPTPTPTPTPVPANSPVVYNNFVEYYFELVTDRKFLQAYQQLSPVLQALEPFSDFIHNQNYTLSTGCWTVIQIPISQQVKNSQAWKVGVELTYTSCSSSTVTSYYWNFLVQNEQGHLVIIQIGLYPTGVTILS